MPDRELDPEIVKYLADKLGKTPGTIKKDIYTMRRTHGRLPVNVVAQMYAVKNHQTVLGKLTGSEKAVIPIMEIEPPVRISQNPKGSRKKKRIANFVQYDTTDTFVRDHILETNKAYTAGCYTAAYILCRKIIENLLTDIIRKKYGYPKREAVELFFDTSRGRTRDFSEILINLRNHAADFGPEKTLLERVLNLSEKFKDDANNKAHSWYHIVRKAELDATSVQDILRMISRLDSLT
jgi:hypothetical protein